MKTVMIYKRFERFWHWSQALLIVFMLITGFEIHGNYELFGFGPAARLHTIAAWTLIGLWIFAIFWHFTTGEWRQYLPTTDKLGAVARYYLVGTFTGERHPFRKTSRAKHNPLQRLAYLAFKLLISPVIWITGVAYLFYHALAGFDFVDLRVIALAHTTAAYAMLTFFIAHVYMATMGKTPMALVKPMVTGYEEVEE